MPVSAKLCTGRGYSTISLSRGFSVLLCDSSWGDAHKCLFPSGRAPTTDDPAPAWLRELMGLLGYLQKSG